jgi:hypothetical protein
VVPHGDWPRVPCHGLGYRRGCGASRPPSIRGSRYYRVALDIVKTASPKKGIGGVGSPAPFPTARILMPLCVCAASGPRARALPARRAMGRSHWPSGGGLRQAPVPPLHRQLPPGHQPERRLATPVPTLQPQSRLPGASLARASVGKELEGQTSAGYAAASGQPELQISSARKLKRDPNAPGIFSVKKPHDLPAMRPKAHRPVLFPAQTGADKVRRGPGGPPSPTGLISVA